MDIYHEILKKYWGYTTFRPLQETIIHSVCAGQDTLGLMPTGGGKSVTFQVPALAMGGICLVVTPLIALMCDQVDNLRRIGIRATTIHSGMNRKEIETELDRCVRGAFTFLYLSPERLATDLFLEKLPAMSISLLVVDESHCISQWGYDFRPAYLRIADIRKLLPQIPVLALTATATPEVIEDIQNRLLFKEKHVFRTSFVRPNLAYIVRHTEDKPQTLVHILQEVPGTAIVYTRNRKQTQEIALYLQQEGIRASYYHAGLSREEKELCQHRWKNDECRVIVATNAFGMGIDKPDVRLVIHLDMPNTLEEYFQEAGRAGRDGEKAYAIALCAETDGAKLKKRMEEEFPAKKFIKQVYEILCDYFQIQEGYGQGLSYGFTLADFCASNSLSLRQTHYALKLLDLAGYLEYHEERDEIFFSTKPQIVFTSPRIPRNKVVIPNSVYEERRKRKIKRISKVVEYLERERICRSRFLINYLGEKITEDCGCCDVCQSRNRSELSNTEFNTIRTLLEKELSIQQPLSLTTITGLLPYPSEKSLTAIRFLVDQDERFYLKDGDLGLREKKESDSHALHENRI